MAVYAVVIIFFCSRGSRYNAYYWAALFISLVCLPYLNAAIRGKFIIYEPIYLYPVGLIFSYTIFLFVPLEDIMLDPVSVSEVMFLLCVGIASFLSGYKMGDFLPIGKKLPLERFMIPEKYFPQLPVILYFLGWIFRAIFEPHIGILPIFGFTNMLGWQIVTILVRNSISAGLMIDAYLYFLPARSAAEIVKKQKYITRLLFFAVTEVFFIFFIDKMRESLVVVIFYTLMVYVITKKKIPYLTVIIFVVLFVSFVMPYTLAYRTEFDDKGSPRDALSFANEIIMDKEVYAEWREGALKRVSNSLVVAELCYRRKSENPDVRVYKNLFDYISRFVPRFIWHNKPVIDYNEIGRKIGMVAPNDERTCISVTSIARCILDGGIPVVNVIIIFFITGIILKTYWVWLVVRPKESLFPFIIYINLLYTWLRDEELAITLHSNIALIAYIYILLVFVRRKRYARTS